MYFFTYLFTNNTLIIICIILCTFEHTFIIIESVNIITRIFSVSNCSFLGGNKYYELYNTK